MVINKTASNEASVYFVLPQKNLQSLQSAVECLQKEKENLIVELRAKTDSKGNHAK